MTMTPSNNRSCSFVQDLAAIVFELKDEVVELRQENNLLKNVLKEIVNGPLDDKMSENLNQGK